MDGVRFRPKGFVEDATIWDAGTHQDVRPTEVADGAPLAKGPEVGRTVASSTEQ